MNIIGVSGDCEHNSAVALIREGRLCYAEAEERLSRRKMDGGFPQRALAQALSMTDGGHCLLVGAGHADDPETASFTRAMEGHAHRLGSELLWVDHHLAHARCAAHSLGENEGAVLTADGQGNRITTAYWLLRDGELKPLWQADLDDGSLGFFFAAITEHLGYRRLHDEGKVCALAAAGTENPQLTNIMAQTVRVERTEAGTPRLCIDRKAIGEWDPTRSLLTDCFADQLAPFRPADIALAAQQAVEEALIRILRLLRRSESLGPLAVAGGLFANVRINRRLAELEGIQRLAVAPAMGDDGLAIGAAAEAAKQIGISPRPLTSLYLGIPAKETPQNRHPVFRVFHASAEEIIQTIARLLAAGEVVARCAGPGEFGPRALGNRSIFYRPDDPGAGDWLNHRLGRDPVMPFGPCIRHEMLPEVTPVDPERFSGLGEMTIAVPVTERFHQLCPGVVHLDGTSRIQAVRAQRAPQLWRILEAFQEQTGLPALINTSLNRHREPICRALDDALTCAAAAQLDFVLAGDTMLYHRHSRDPCNGK